MGQSCLLRSATATAADDDAEMKPRTTALVSSADIDEGSGSLPEKAASNVLTKN